MHAAMTTATAVPLTTRGELEGDEALETLREHRPPPARCSTRSLASAPPTGSATRARSPSSSRSPCCPALIAVVGLAAALDQDSFSRVVQATIEDLAPGAVGEILTDALQQGTGAARAESGETALVAGAHRRAVAGTTAMAQVERGANRIYGTERDRPFLRKYLTALRARAAGGLLALLSFVVLVGGSAIRDAAGWGDTIDTSGRSCAGRSGWRSSIASVALLFEYAPRRRQPEPSWLAFGAASPPCSGSASWACSPLYIEATE